jgi:hypothetical protein
VTAAAAAAAGLEGTEGALLLGGGERSGGAALAMTAAASKPFLGDGLLGLFLSWLGAALVVGAAWAGEGRPSDSRL